MDLFDLKTDAQQHSTSLLLFLENLHQTSSFSDLKIVCQDGELQCYRVLLGACSRLLQGCLEKEDQEDSACLIIPELKVKELEYFHKALFCSSPDLTQLESVLKVLSTLGVNTGDFIDLNMISSSLKEEHLPSVELEQKVEYVCLFCDSKMSSIDQYELHLAQHRGGGEEEEQTAIFTFDINERDEIVARSGLSCARCLTEFLTEEEFDQHKDIECSKLYMCRTCNKSFSSSQTLSNHTKLHTKELEYECGLCGKLYVSRSVLGNHMKTHDSASKVPRFDCIHCPKKFTHPSNLKRHIRTAHFEMSDKKTYNCTECPKTFRDPSALKHHSKIHLDVRPFPCHICPKSFGSKTQLDNHQRIHTGEKPFICNLCSRCFVTKGQLKSHRMNRHVGVKHDKAHLCQECGQSFVKDFDLKVHMRKHTGERPFPCPDCGKTFRSERNLVNHTRIHSGDKPYQCESCDKRFASCAGLRQHFKCHAACRLQATEGAYCRQERKPNRYGRVRLESIPELCTDEASSLQTLDTFSVAELKYSQGVEETVVYFNPEDSGLSLGGLEGVTIQAIGLDMDVGESLVQIADSIG